MQVVGDEGAIDEEQYTNACTKHHWGLLLSGLLSLVLQHHWGSCGFALSLVLQVVLQNCFCPET
jgi:hypothetical protein